MRVNLLIQLAQQPLNGSSSSTVVQREPSQGSPDFYNGHSRVDLKWSQVSNYKF